LSRKGSSSQGIHLAMQQYGTWLRVSSPYTQTNSNSSRGWLKRTQEVYTLVHDPLRDVTIQEADGSRNGKSQPVETSVPGVHAICISVVVVRGEDQNGEVLMMVHAAGSSDENTRGYHRAISSGTSLPESITSVLVSPHIVESQKTSHSVERQREGYPC
jgi:hypothetical protein